jgi:hypothetical protein
MAQKREADLINLRIVEKTEKVFPDETVILSASTNFMRRVTRISSDQISLLSSEPYLGPSIDLFCRIRELLIFRNLFGKLRLC